MKRLFFLIIMLISFQSTSSSLQQKLIEDGMYYAYWIGQDGKKVTSILPSKPLKIDDLYYMKNNINDESNDEIYMTVSSGVVTFFYKHDELEGGPLIGWRNAISTENGLITTSGISKRLYSNEGDALDKAYSIGDKFDDGFKSANQNEIIPITKINKYDLKLNCHSYLQENSKKLKGKYSIRDYSQNYNDIIFMSDSGICGTLLDQSSSENIKNGWILLEKIK